MRTSPQPYCAPSVYLRVRAVPDSYPRTDLSIEQTNRVETGGVSIRRLHHRLRTARGTSRNGSSLTPPSSGLADDASSKLLGPSTSNRRALEHFAIKAAREQPYQLCQPYLGPVRSSNCAYSPRTDRGNSLVQHRPLPYRGSGETDRVEPIKAGTKGQRLRRVLSRSRGSTSSACSNRSASSKLNR